MVISSWFLTNDLPRYPEDRLVIVLFHEFAAFGYSLEMAKELAEKGDFGPLEQVLKNLKIPAKTENPKTRIPLH
jgi:hypothetical protein